MRDESRNVFCERMKFQLDIEIAEPCVIGLLKLELLLLECDR
jgi:hypothetical protein